MITDARKLTVQSGYDRLGPTFGDWCSAIEGDPWKRFVDELTGRLPERASVLDLGCGDGQKTKHLAERFEVTGVDISAEQLRLARAAAPRASFIQGDFECLDLPAESFSAVTALYSLVHVPRDGHAELFCRIAGWLPPGGLFLAALSHMGAEDWTGEWLGVEMFFSGFPAEINRRLIREAGLELLLDELVFMQEPEGEVSFLWVLARKPE